MKTVHRATVETSIASLPPSAVVIVPVHEGDTVMEQPIARQLGGDRLRTAAERGEVQARPYATTLLHSDGRSPGLLLIGAGRRETADGRMLKLVAAAAARYLTGRTYSEIAWVDAGHLAPFTFAQAVTEGLLYGSYDAALNKTSKPERCALARTWLISARESSALEAGARVGAEVGTAASIARDLVNCPPNELTPLALCERAREIGERTGLTSTLLGEREMRELGMGALLGVAAGSAQPPAIAFLEYGDRAAEAKVALVGKGITFDAGGLQAKTAEGMTTMKDDMGGAAAVIAAMHAVAALEPHNVRVTGYLGATENMPGGRAMRPGDVLHSMKGKTIEILSTDAEGRLVLSDLLAYAESRGATHIVDVATLTTGAVVALGSSSMLVTGRSPEWVEQVVEDARGGLERAWPMPMFEEYRRAMDSEIADLKNSAGRWGSALTAAAFLGEFVDHASWAHIDIAGTAWADDPAPYQPKGATGSGVGTLVSIIRRLSGEVSGA